MIDIYENRDTIIEELDLLERLRISYLRRKLNAGLLLIPEGLQFNIEDEESLAELLTNEMVRILQFPDLLGTVVPIVIQGPEELLDQVRHIKFTDESMLDVEKIEERIARLKERIEAFDDLAESMVQ